MNIIEKLKAASLPEKLRGLRMNKYLALGLICLLLLGSILLAAGRAEPVPEPVESRPVPASTESREPEPTEPPPAPAGAVAPRGLELDPAESVFGLCRDGDGAAALLLRWDDDAKVWRSRLVRLDPKTAAVTGETELEPIGDILYLSTPALREGQICFVDAEQERCAAFDRSGRFLGLQDFPVMDRAHLGWRNRLLADDCFRKEESWAEFSRSDSGSLNHVIAFYDEADRLHTLGEACDQILAAQGHRLLTVRLDENTGPALALLDLDAGLCVDRLSLRAEDGADEGWVNLNHGLLGEDWALLALSRETGEQTVHSLCFWYPQAGAQSPIETELLTEQLLSDEIELRRQALEQSGVVLHLDEAPDPALTPTTGLSVLENTCETGASRFGQYWILRQLSEFTEKLPAGMLREMYAELPESGPGDPEALHIYIVRSIPGDASAFASVWTETPLLCFATEEFNPSHLAHEFMHLMDLRLTRWLDSQRRVLENEWAALSPDYAYDQDLSQEQSDSLEAYFVSWYARTNGAEDRAESFQALFDSEEPVAAQWWYADKPAVQAKLRWLTAALREAFPSVQAVEKAYWEKLPPEE